MEFFDAHSHVVKRSDIHYALRKDDLLISHSVSSPCDFVKVLTKVGFDSEASLKKLASLDDATKEAILEQIKEDLYRVLPDMHENVYGYGKQVARLAQLAYITDLLESKQLDSETGLNGTPMAKQAAELLFKYLSAYLDSKNSDNLVYDKNFGGMISKDGLLNREADFGNGWYVCL